MVISYLVRTCSVGILNPFGIPETATKTTATHGVINRVYEYSSLSAQQ